MSAGIALSMTSKTTSSKLVSATGAVGKPPSLRHSLPISFVGPQQCHIMQRFLSRCGFGGIFVTGRVSPIVVLPKTISSELEPIVEFQEAVKLLKHSKAVMVETLLV